MEEPPDELGPEASAIWRQVVATRPEAAAQAMELANYCVATVRARRLDPGDSSNRACSEVSKQRALADRLGLDGAWKEAARQRTPQVMVRVRGLPPGGVPEGSSYVANDGSEVEVVLEPGEESDVTEGFARMLERLGLVEVITG